MLLTVVFFLTYLTFAILKDAWAYMVTHKNEIKKFILIAEDIMYTRDKFLKM